MDRQSITHAALAVIFSVVWGLCLYNATREKHVYVLPDASEITRELDDFSF